MRNFGFMGRFKRALSSRSRYKIIAMPPLLGRVFLIAAVLVAIARSQTAPDVNTFSIVAFDPATGELGVAVESKYFGVGSVVPWAKAGVGAVATQAWAKIGYGAEGLRLMEAGASARE